MKRWCFHFTIPVTREAPWYKTYHTEYSLYWCYAIPGLLAVAFEAWKV